MIARLIAASARNLILVLIGTVFAVAAGVYAVLHLPLDAIPDLSDTQVIVYTEYPGQAPQVVEDQVTYPLTTAMLTVPRSRVVRGFSYFGVSFVYVVFEDGTDIYWARSRVLEYLNAATRRLPGGVTPTLGPDATGVGWVYQYVLLAKDRSLAELRSLQDWYVRYGLAKAEGVAEIASVGGFVKQYNVLIDPQRLRTSISRSPRSAMRSAPAIWMWAGAPSSSPNSSTSYAGAAISRASATWKTSFSRTTAARPFSFRTWRESNSDRTNAEASPSSTATARSPAASCCSASAPTRSMSSTTLRSIGEIAGSLPKGVDIVAVYLIGP
jgi:copper/silver efflux system protein